MRARIIHRNEMASTHDQFIQHVPYLIETSMKKDMTHVLLISGHPDLAHSFANKAIVEALQGQLGEAIRVRRLDVLYPDYRIDVPAEQQALLEADVIVWQFPFYWYSLPALMKKWLDDVFVRGFAHGSTQKLAGKKLILSFTTGAPEAMYAYGQAMNYPVADFLAPLRQTALLCRFDYQEPVFSNGMMAIPGVSSDADFAAVKAKAEAHAERLIAQLRPLIQRKIV